MNPPFATLWIQLTPDSAARVSIAVVEAGLGAIDAERERHPTLSEMDQISAGLVRREWIHTKPN